MQTLAIVLFKIFFFLFAINLQAQSHANTGTYLYHIAKFFEWDQTQKKDFIIGIYGNHQGIKKSILKMILTKKKFREKKIVAKVFKKIDEIRYCNILFICHKEKRNILDIVEKTKDWNTLIVGESPGMARKGAVVNFTFPNEKIKFELNKKAAKKRNLKISRLIDNFVILIE